MDYDDDGEIDIYFSTTDQLGGTTGGELTSVADRSAVLNFTKVTTSSTVNENDDDKTDRYAIDLAGVSSTKISDGDAYYFYALMDVDDDGTPDAGYQSGQIVVEHQTSISITSPATDVMTTTDYTISWLQKWDDEDTVSMDVDLYYDTTKTKTLSTLDDNIGSTNAPSGIIELDVAMDGSDDGSRYDDSISTVWDDIVVTDTDGADQNASATTTVFFDTDLSGAGDDYYNGRRFVVTAGGLEGETGTIQDYVSSSGKVTLSSALSRAMNDDETTEVQSYKIYVPDDTYYVYAVLDVNGDSKYNVTSSVTGTTDAAGSSTTIGDSSGLSTIDDYYNGCRVTITDTSNDSYGSSRAISDEEGDGVGGTAGTIPVSHPYLDSTGADTTVGSGVTFRIDPLETYSVSVGTITISNYTVEVDTPDDYHDIDQVFNVDFKLDTNGQAITGLNLYLDFNTDTLELDNPGAPFCTVTTDTTDVAGNTAGTTINGSSSLSSVDDYYNDYKVVITSGVCKGESRTISDYDSSTNTLTVNPAFSDRIDSSVTFEINQPLSDTNNSVSSWTVYVVENDGDNTAGTLTLALLSTNPNATAIASSSRFVSVAFKAIAAGDEDMEVIFDDVNSRMTRMIDDDGEEHIPHVAGSTHVRTSSTTTSSISGTVELQSYAGTTYPQMTFELRKPGVYGHYSGYTSPEDEDSETIGIQLTPANDGSFTLTQVPAGKYFLTAKAPHYLRGQNDDATPLEVRPGQTIEDVTIKGYNDANSDGDYADSGEEYDYLLAGDTNSSTYAEDNAVTAYDVTNLVNNYGEGGDTTVADIDGDGDVDIVDFKLISNNWGVCAIKPTSGAAGVNNSAPAASADGVVEIIGLANAIYLGDEIEVQIAVNADVDATGFGLDLEFDADKVKLSQVQEGDFFAGKTLFVNKELALGSSAQSRTADRKLSIRSATFDKASQRGILVRFKLTPTAIGNLTLTLKNGQLIGRDDVVNFTQKTVVEVIGRPTKSELLQNYPNPFNPETWIPFALKQDADVKIRIYNVSGQLVRTLNLGQKRAEHYITKDKAAYWNGRNAIGERVASGIYFYQIQAGKFNDVKRMVILK